MGEIIERLDDLREYITELEKIIIDENKDLETIIDNKFSKIKIEFLRLKNQNSEVK